MTESVRSLMTAGVTAAMVAATAVVPISDRTPISVESTAVTLSAALSPLLQPSPAAAVTASATSAGNAIIVAYDTLEPWVAYGFELADWALSFVPGVWWFAPAVDLAYFTAEPIVQSLVYSFAYLIDGEPSLIGPTLAQGINDAATNFVIYSFYWFTSLVPLPPVPPFPVFPVASVAPAAASVVSRAARVASSATAELETATDVGIEAADAGSTEQPDATGTIAAEAGTIAAEAPTARPAPGRSSRAQRTAAKVAPPKTVTAQTRIDTPASAAETADTSVAKPVKAPGRAARDAARAARSGMDG